MYEYGLEVYGFSDSYETLAELRNCKSIIRYNAEKQCWFVTYHVCTDMGAISRVVRLSCSDNVWCLENKNENYIIYFTVKDDRVVGAIITIDNVQVKKCNGTVITYKHARYLEKYVTDVKLFGSSALYGLLRREKFSYMKRESFSYV